MPHVDIQGDTIDFADVDITDVKHVFGPPFMHNRARVIVTIADAQLQVLDIQKMMEKGMDIARFKTSHSTNTDKAKLIEKFDTAGSVLASKYGVPEWSCATCIELKTNVIQTGLLEEDVPQLMIETDTEVILTTEISEFDKCNAQQIFVDNPFLTSDVEIGMEINISQEEIIMVCTEKYEKSVKCKITQGGYLQNMAYVCMRGCKRTRPYAVTKKDLDLIKFTVEYQVDLILINYPLNVDTVMTVKKYLGSSIRCRPVIFTGICTQEGIKDLDDYIRESDGIIISREFLAYEVEPALYNRMGRIQSYIAGKCNQAGKPFYISGVFKEGVTTGNIIDGEIAEVTNALLEGASGFALHEYTNLDYVCDVLKTINGICTNIEPLTMKKTEFWQLMSKTKIPMNAGEAAALSCAAVANQSNARIIIVPTVTGRTPYLLNCVRPNSIIIGITARVRTMRILKLFRNIIPLLYKGGFRRTWFSTVQARIHFGVEHALKNHWIRYGDHYVTLEKGTEESSYCDTVRVWNVSQDEGIKSKYFESRCRLETEEVEKIEINKEKQKSAKNKIKHKTKDVDETEENKSDKKSKEEEDGNEERDKEKEKDEQMESEDRENGEEKENKENGEEKDNKENSEEKENEENGDDDQEKDEEENDVTE